MHRTLVLFGMSLIIASCADTDPQVRPRFSMNNQLPRPTVGEPRAQGETDLSAGRYEQAIEQFRVVLRRDPFDTTALNGLGIAYSALGRHQIARDYFERALALDPGSAATLNNLGRSWMNEAQWQAAVVYLQRARANDNVDPQIARNLETALLRARTQQALLTESTAAAVPRLIEPLIPASRMLHPQARVLRLQEKQPGIPVAQGAPEQGATGATAADTALAEPTPLQPTTLPVSRVPVPLPVRREAPALHIADAAHVPPSVVVLNGTGRRGMAARFKGYIERQGSYLGTPANADRYTYRTSVIFYGKGRELDARRLAGDLPRQVDLVRRDAVGSSLWLLLGSDLLDLDRQMLAGDGTTADVGAGASAGAPS